jgi:hypothetical protein
MNLDPCLYQVHRAVSKDGVMALYVEGADATKAVQRLTSMGLPPAAVTIIVQVHKPSAALLIVSFRSCPKYDKLCTFSRPGTGRWLPQDGDATTPKPLLDWPASAPRPGKLARPGEVTAAVQTVRDGRIEATYHVNLLIVLVFFTLFSPSWASPVVVSGW